jgi:hypothetical protein
MGILISRSAGPQLPVVNHESGLYYSTPFQTFIQDNAAETDRLAGCPIYIPNAGSYDRLLMRVATAGAGSAVRMGIRTMTANGPGTLVLDAGTVSTASTGLKTITINQALDVGWYCLEAVSQGGTPPVVSWISQSGGVSFGTSDENIAMLVGNGYYSQGSVSGALPAGPFTGGVQATGAIRVAIRRT